MTREIKHKGGGGKLNRSETVTVRLDPKLRYLIEMASRKQRRTVSSFIEWALEESLNFVNLPEDQGDGNKVDISISKSVEKLWDIDEADRFIKLAFHFPDLMNHEEQILWKHIQECGLLWKGRFDLKSGDWFWKADRCNLDILKLRENWDLFMSVARNKATKDSLPTWIKHTEIANLNEHGEAFL